MTTVAVEDLKRTHRVTWAAGDYAAVSDAITNELVPAEVLGRVGVEAEQELLDVATGTGNLALLGASWGARATGLDLTPELFETARGRARELGLDVEWVEGDAEALPFADASFDCVVSAFGIQFAPRHELVARELARVCRPGGAIGLANWTPEGAIGELFAIMGRYLPPAPEYASPPPRWGSEEHVRGLFEASGVELSFDRTTTPLRFSSGEHFVSFMETCYGPMVKAREKLTGERRWDDCRGEIVAMLERRDEGGDDFCVPAEYLVVVGRRR